MHPLIFWLIVINLAFLAISQWKGIVTIMTEKEALDALKAFIGGPLTDYLKKLAANQTDPADIAETQEILTTLQGLVPSDSGGGTP
jgi:hypothetical protein